MMWKRWSCALLIVVILNLNLAAQPGPRPPAIEETFVQNPTSGAALFVQTYPPLGSNETTHPAVVLIPGGSGAGSASFRPPEVARYVELGLLVVVFDPDGRGRSSGVEDNNGFTHQDGLKAVIEFAADHPRSNGQVILVSYSYGVTMATGTLARYPELPVSFYVDWEGPADRTDTGGCDAAQTGHLRDAGCDNEAFWSEREAATFIGEIQVPYQRIQSERDHVQPDNDHAILLINNATHTSYGGNGQAPWTRLNDEAPNQVFTTNDPNSWLSEDERPQDVIVHHLRQFLQGMLFSATETSNDAVLQIGIMVHLEGWPLQEQAAFERYATLIREYADLFEKYDAKLTLESKESTLAIHQYGDNFLKELELAGHGIGVHADLGFDPRGQTTYPQFVQKLSQMKTQLDALGVNNRHVSGICSSLDWVSAAVEAGYQFTTGIVAYCYSSMPEQLRPPAYRNCPNPAACHQPFSFELKDRLHPWRAASGARWIEHDPSGKLVILPQSFGLSCFAEETRSTASNTRCEFTEADIDAYIDQLESALLLAEEGKVNIFYVSWSLGGQLNPALLERWLQSIEIYVQSGQVVWKTLPEMYDSYLSWEQHQGTSPSLESILDTNRNNYLDDDEILNAVRLWIAETSVLDHHTIGDEKIVELVQLWVQRAVLSETKPSTQSLAESDV